MKPSEYHACATGDCDHDTDEECVVALALHADELHRSLVRLQAGVPMLVHLAATDAREGHEPSIYLRGDKWRYHVDRAGNQWEDHADPSTAAEKAKKR